MKKTVGRLEKVDLPQLDLHEIVAKVDTGAYSCSLHCSNIKHVDEQHVTFNLLDPDHPHYHGQTFTLPISKIKRVKSSSGEAEERIFITTQIALFGEIYEVELSLTDRSRMKYPMLIGRKFLKNKFVVDVTKSCLSDTTHEKETT